MKNFLLFIAILIISSLCITDDNKEKGYSENKIISKDKQILKNENASYEVFICENPLQKGDNSSVSVGNCHASYNSFCSQGVCWRAIGNYCWVCFDETKGFFCGGS